MSALRAGAAALLAAALSFSPFPGQAATTPGMLSGHLPGGGSYIVNPVSDLPVTVIELWYRAPSVGFSTPRPSLGRLAAETVIASKPLVGESLGATIADVGGRLSVDVSANSVAVSALVPAFVADDVVKRMSAAFFAPVVTEDGYETARRFVARQSLSDAYDVGNVARDAVFESLFTEGAQHYPEIGTLQSIADISVEGVRAYAERAFRSSNAVLVVDGDTDASILQSVAGARRMEARGPEPILASKLAASPQTVTRVWDQPGGAYGWAGPPIGDERAATALDFVADYLFQPQFGAVARRLADTEPDATISGQFITLHDPGVFLVVFTGGKPDVVRTAIDASILDLSHPLPPAVFAAAREAFEYRLLSDLQTSSAVADNLGWYTVEGNGAYAPGAGGERGEYFRTAASLTPEFVARTVRRYLAAPQVRVNFSTATSSGKGVSS